MSSIYSSSQSNQSPMAMVYIYFQHPILIARSTRFYIESKRLFSGISSTARSTCHTMMCSQTVNYYQYQLQST